MELSYICFVAIVECVGCELHPETHGESWPQSSELLQHMQPSHDSLSQAVKLSSQSVIGRVKV